MPEIHTPRQIGDLAVQLSIMSKAEIKATVDADENGVRAVFVMAAVASGVFDPDEDPEPPKAA
jgi:hypothetical protein